MVTRIIRYIGLKRLLTECTIYHGTESYTSHISVNSAPLARLHPLDDVRDSAGTGGFLPAPLLAYL